MQATDPDLRARLLELAALDLRLRDALAQDGRLYDGYHPDMRACHENNAHALMEIVTAHGWPHARLAGDDGAQAAWLVVQHAISLPHFQRDCLNILQGEAAAGRIPPWQPAKLLDRILVFEGRPQIYGTQFDWDEKGAMSPLPIKDADSVNARRAAVGLETLAENIARLRAENNSAPVPKDMAKRKKESDAFAKSVGWRA